jgi:peptidoglycan/xylan/chitin deacetylase (PgdA/CDA1 family)
MRPAGPASTARPYGAGGLAGRLEQGRVRKEIARPVVLRPARPTVSFSFDGFSRSAARSGAGLLQNVGGCGTFYASASLAGTAGFAGPLFEAEDIVRLSGAGHEIGCATFSGRDCTRASLDDVFADMVRNADVLAAMGLERRLISFAYPHGNASAALKAQLPSRFTGGRGVHPGLASGRADAAQLRANALFGAGALRRCLAVLEEARRRSGWVIFYAHDVGPRPSPWGVPTGLLERLCGAAFTSSMRILPVGDAMARITAESAR